MSIENCPECRMQISSYAEICPYCGSKVDLKEGEGSYSVSIVSIPNFAHSFPLISKFLYKATGQDWENILIDELKHLPFEVACGLNLRNMKLVKKELEEMGCTVNAVAVRFPIEEPYEVTNQRAYFYFDKKMHAPKCCPRCKSTNLICQRETNFCFGKWTNNCLKCNYSWRTD